MYNINISRRLLWDTVSAFFTADVAQYASFDKFSPCAIYLKSTNYLCICYYPRSGLFTFYWTNRVQSLTLI